MDFDPFSMEVWERVKKDGRKALTYRTQSQLYQSQKYVGKQIFKNKINKSTSQFLPHVTLASLYPKASLTAALWNGLLHPVRALEAHVKQMISAA